MAMTRLRSIGRIAAEVLYPPRCAGCGHRGDWVCNRCREQSASIPPPWCTRCGGPRDLGCICDRLAPALDWARSARIYDGWVRAAISSFKYENERARVDHLAALLTEALREPPEQAVVVPVPLHPSRRRSRGYNQSELLAVAVALATGSPVEHALIKSRATRPQMGLSADERAVNVRDAFEIAGGAQVEGRSFLLVDDVLTTGATISACAETLKRARARWVGAATVARDR
jgi:ComF family protein